MFIHELDAGVKCTAAGWASSTRVAYTQSEAMQMRSPHSAKRSIAGKALPTQPKPEVAANAFQRIGIQIGIVIHPKVDAGGG